MRRMPIWLVLGVAVFILGCGGGGGQSQSPAPTPSIAATALSQKQQLVTYLDEFARHQPQANAVIKRLRKLINTPPGSHPSSASLATLIVHLRQNAKELKRMSVVYARILPPPSAERSHELYVRFLRDASLAQTATSDWLASGGNATYERRFMRLVKRMDSEYGPSLLKLQAAANRYGIQLPSQIAPA